MVEVLAYYNIKPIFVFDGRSIDLKAETNSKRTKEKEEFKAKATELLKEGKIE
jgi:5'-3' exonuclease